MAKIYSLVTDSDAGTECELFHTAAERDAKCYEYCKADWSDRDGPMPDDWEAAWDIISQRCDWWLVVKDHDIDPAKLEQCSIHRGQRPPARRVWVPIKRCGAAVTTTAAPTTGPDDRARGSRN